MSLHLRIHLAFILHNGIANGIPVFSRRRVSSAINADKIIVIRDGKVIEQGSHNSLLQVNGHYSNLWVDQTTIKSIAPVITNSLSRVQYRSSKEASDRLPAAKHIRVLQGTGPPRSVMPSDEDIRASGAAAGRTVREANCLRSNGHVWRPDAPEFIPSFQLLTLLNLQPRFPRGHEGERDSTYDFQKQGRGELSAARATCNDSNRRANALSGRSANVGSAVNPTAESSSSGPEYMMPRQPSKWRIRREFTKSEPTDIGMSPT